MTERLTGANNPQSQRERAKELLGQFKPRSSETHDESIRQEDLDKILDAIKIDSSLTDEERALLIEEATNRYDRTAKVPVYAHMGI